MTESARPHRRERGARIALATIAIVIAACALWIGLGRGGSSDSDPVVGGNAPHTGSPGVQEREPDENGRENGGRTRVEDDIEPPIEEASLVVILRDESGSPVESANVEIESDAKRPLRARTNRSGRAVFREQLTGPLEIRCSASDIDRPSTALVAQNFSRQASDSPIELTIRRGDSIAGRVTTGSGSGIESVIHIVRVEDGRRRRFGVARTDEVGEFWIGGLERCSYELHAEPTLASLRYSLGTATTTATPPLYGPVLMALTTKNSIRGVLTDERGRPVVGALLAALPTVSSGESAPVNATRVTDADGRFAIEGTRDGDCYWLRIRSDDTWSDVMAVGGSVDVRAIARPGASLHGSVRDSIGPLRRTTIRATGRDGHTHDCETDEDGFFVLGRLAKGERYDIEAVLSGGNVLIESAAEPGERPLDLELE